MPKEDELETEDLNAGNETETDAVLEDESDEDGAEGETAAEVDAEPEEGQVEKPSRGETRFQKLANEAKQAREEAATVRRELAEFKTSQRQQTQQESPEQVAQRLALMSPEERLEYKLDQAERRNQGQMQAMAFQMQDGNDKAAFQALCASDTIAARYKDRVEDKLREIRTTGQNVNREALLDFLVGQDIRSKGGAARSKQKNEGERRIARQRVTPSNNRGDNQPARRGDKSLEEKLEGVTF